jgi:hypothetical protein
MKNSPRHVEYLMSAKNGMTVRELRCHCNEQQFNTVRALGHLVGRNNAL